MKPQLLLVFALMGCLLGGCSAAGKANPYAKGDTWCTKIFGLPPSAFAKCLKIEEDLPLRPKDLPPRSEEEDF